jgi:hypothetical protein
VKAATRVAQLTTAATLSLALLAGCTAAPQDTQPAPTAKPPVPVEVIEEINVEQLAADTLAGDVVTAEQAAELNRGDLGVRAWKMADGTFVAVREDAATPAAVVADVEVRAAAAITPIDPANAMSGGNQVTIGDADRFINQSQRELGKKVMAVYQIFTHGSGNDDPSTASLRWKIRNNVMMTFPTVKGETLEQAVARAEAIVAGFPDASAWVVVVKP